DLWGTCKAYGTVVDVYIPYKKSKAANIVRYQRERKTYDSQNSFKRNVRISSDSFKGDVENYSNSFASVLKSGKPVTEATRREVPSLVLGDICFSDRDFNFSLMGITSLPNLYVILEEEGFQNFKISYLGGMWVLIELESSTASQKFIKHAGVGSWFSSLQPARFFFFFLIGFFIIIMGERNWNSYRSKEDLIQKISKSIFVTNFPDHISARDLWGTCKAYGTVVDVYIPYKKSKAESDGNSKEGELKYLPGFTPKETFVNEVHEKEMEAPSEEVKQNSYN
nr:hypothetical protein [Tanacetum cinerariifolium]